MRFTSTLTGLVVLALVVAGVYWVRLRPLPSQGATAREAVSIPVTASPPSPQGRSVAAAMVEHGQGDEAWADVTAADATVDAGGVGITFSIASRPAVALERTRVRIRAQSRGSVVALEGARISFEMTMPMGDHRYLLVPGQDGWQEAEVILPLCMSGKRRWFATVEGTAAGRLRTARFRLDLAPPTP